MTVKHPSYPEQEGRPCVYCGRTMTYLLVAEPIADCTLDNSIGGMDAPWFPSRDHRLSKHRGGTDDPANLAYCDSRCNVAKGVMTDTEFLVLLGSEDDRYLDLLYVSGCCRAGVRRRVLQRGTGA